MNPFAYDVDDNLRPTGHQTFQAVTDNAEAISRVRFFVRFGYVFGRNGVIYQKTPTGFRVIRGAR